MPRCLKASGGYSHSPVSLPGLPLYPRREPGVPAASAARIPALAGRRQGAGRPPHRFALEPQPLLQDVHPPRLPGAPVGVPPSLVLVPVGGPLQPAPLHLSAHPAEGRLPGPVPVHPGLSRLGPPGREGVHQVPGASARQHEARVGASPQQHDHPGRGGGLSPPPHHHLPTLRSRVQLRTLPTQQPARGLPHRLRMQVEAQGQIQHR